MHSERRRNQLQVGLRESIEKIQAHEPDLIAVSWNLLDSNRDQIPHLATLLMCLGDATPVVIALQEVHPQTIQYLLHPQGANLSLQQIAWTTDFFRAGDGPYLNVIIHNSNERLVPVGPPIHSPLHHALQFSDSQVKLGIHESLSFLWQHYVVDGQPLCFVNIHAGMAFSHLGRKVQLSRALQKVSDNCVDPEVILLAGDFNGLGNPLANSAYGWLPTPPWSVADGNIRYEPQLIKEFLESHGFSAAFNELRSTAFPHHWWNAAWALLCEKLGYHHSIDNILIKASHESTKFVGCTLGPNMSSDHRSVITGIKIHA